MADYQILLTNDGADKIEAAYQAGEVITITSVALGDGGGAAVTPDPSVTALVNQWGEVPPADGGSTEAMITGVFVVTSVDYPDQIIREIGLYDTDGTLIAYGGYPETWLPNTSDGASKQVEGMFAMPIVHAESVTLEVDPNIAILTIDTADKRYLQILNNLSEIAAKGEDAQKESQDNLGLKSAATHDDSEYVKSVNSHSPDESDGSVIVTSPDIFNEQAILLSDTKSLSNLTTPGLYYRTTAPAEGLDYPSGEAGSLVILRDAGITQIYREYAQANGNSPREYRRSYIQDEDALIWSLWAQVFDSTNPQPIPSPPDLSGYETIADANARFITGFRMANYASFGSEGIHDSSQMVLTGIYANNGWDNPSTQEARQAQYEINGSWYNAAYV